MGTSCKLEKKNNLQMLEGVFIIAGRRSNVTPFPVLHLVPVTGSCSTLYWNTCSGLLLTGLRRMLIMSLPGLELITSGSMITCKYLLTSDLSVCLLISFSASLTALLSFFSVSLAALAFILSAADFCLLVPTEFSLFSICFLLEVFDLVGILDRKGSEVDDALEDTNEDDFLIGDAGDGGVIVRELVGGGLDITGVILEEVESSLTLKALDKVVLSGTVVGCLVLLVDNLLATL